MAAEARDRLAAALTDDDAIVGHSPSLSHRLLFLHCSLSHLPLELISLAMCMCAQI